MIQRKAFTMVELISVIVIIGILSSIAIPKFTGVKDQAKKSTELATASAVSAALESIHGTWSISDDDFDWNNDGVIDDIDVELAPSGYPYELSRDDDAIGALIKASGKSGFKKQYENNSTHVYRVYTAKASDPDLGVKFPSNSARDIEGKPDKNDFWLYMVDTNSSNKCYVEVPGASKKRQIISGDFILIDVNQTAPVAFDSDITIDCS
jgi:prepilin-type N-terminal cleavage/methylation domain-containing protein